MNVYIVRMLLEAGTDLNLAAGQGCISLITAVLAPTNPVVVKMLQEAGTDLTTPEEDGDTPSSSSPRVRGTSTANGRNPLADLQAFF